jgi:hypothetical protein
MHNQKNKMKHTFKEWLMDYEHVMRRTFLEGETPKASQRRGQMDWLIDKNGKIIVDFIGRFENLSEDFDVIRNKLKISAKLPKLNATSHGSYRDAYDNEMIDFVYKYCKRDIKEFGYEF